jgi:hypothetical protein
MSQVITREDLENRFVYHAPNNRQQEKYVKLRLMAFTLAASICDYTPASREQSLAITKLEEVIFWANAAIARNE